MKRRESFASFHAGKEKFNPLLPPPLPSSAFILRLFRLGFCSFFSIARHARGKGERGL